MSPSAIPAVLQEPGVYKGTNRKLVVALDVGTTFSAASYCLLEPGKIPDICRVTKYPGPDASSGSLKIPTMMYYNRAGNVKAVGSECMTPENEENAEDEGWMKVEWFKLRMRPRSLPMKLRTAQLPPLPASKSLIEVFGDYFAYLVVCIKSFIQSEHPTLSQEDISSLFGSAAYVIAHPNGWEGTQQSKLRNAAIYAKMVPDTPEGRSRIVFVSEGEASLHYCVKGGHVDDTNKGFIVADLGGGTLDFSAYKVTGVKPFRVEEVAASKCDLDGSTFVTLRAKGFISTILQDSKFGKPEQIDAIVDNFDRSAKRTFRGGSVPCAIVFGSPLDNDREHGIRAGMLKLTSEEVATFFEPSIKSTVEAILTLAKDSPVDIARVCCVGGFSSSPYLISEVRKRLESSNIFVNTPDNQATKVVPNGALSFYIDHFVIARVSKFMYAVGASRPYDSSLPDHQLRKDNIYIDASGEECVLGALYPVLHKGIAVSEETEFIEEFWSVQEKKAFASQMESNLYVYDGPGAPLWKDEAASKGIFRKLLTLKADLKSITKLHKSTEVGGRDYWECSYDIRMKFGGPELLVFATWKEGGVERRTPVQIIYEDLAVNPDGEDDEEFDDVDSLPARVQFANMHLNGGKVTE